MYFPLCWLFWLLINFICPRIPLCCLLIFSYSRQEHTPSGKDDIVHSFLLAHSYSNEECMVLDRVLTVLADVNIADLLEENNSIEEYSEPTNERMIFIGGV